MLGGALKVAVKKKKMKKKGPQPEEEKAAKVGWGIGGKKKKKFSPNKLPDRGKGAVRLGGQQYTWKKERLPVGEKKGTFKNRVCLRLKNQKVRERPGWGTTL